MDKFACKTISDRNSKSCTKLVYFLCQFSEYLSRSSEWLVLVSRLGLQVAKQNSTRQHLVTPLGQYSHYGLIVQQVQLRPEEDYVVHVI